MAQSRQLGRHDGDPGNTATLNQLAINFKKGL